MRPITRSVLIAAVGVCILVGIHGALNGCTTLSQAAQIEAMSETDYIAWRNTLVAQVSIVAEAALAEDEIEAADMEKIASVLTVIGGSNQVEAGKIAEWIDLSGYKAALLHLTLLELNSKLVAGGAYVDGLLTARGKEIFIHLGAALNDIAS